MFVYILSLFGCLSILLTALVDVTGKVRKIQANCIAISKQHRILMKLWKKRRKQKKKSPRPAKSKGDFKQKSA